MSSHPPYTGPKVRCTKCGHKGAYTNYMATGRCMHVWPYVVDGFDKNPRLHRERERCSHQWDEATVEQQPAT